MKSLPFAAGLGCGFFVGCLIAPKPKPPKTIWTAENAPPAFEDVEPHAYAPAPHVPCCALCGGGPQNPIHI